MGKGEFLPHLSCEVALSVYFMGEDKVHENLKVNAFTAWSYILLL